MAAGYFRGLTHNTAVVEDLYADAVKYCYPQLKEEVEERFKIYCNRYDPADDPDGFFGNQMDKVYMIVGYIGASWMQKQAKILLNKINNINKNKKEFFEEIKFYFIENIYNPIAYLINASELLTNSIKNNNEIEFHNSYKIIKEILNGLLSGIRKVITDLNNTKSTNASKMKRLLYKQAEDKSVIDLFQTGYLTQIKRMIRITKEAQNALEHYSISNAITKLNNLISIITHFLSDLNKIRNYIIDNKKVS